MSKKLFVERWHSDAFESRDIAYQIFDDVKNKLKVIPHSFTGWRSYPNQKLKTISINKNGLRNKDLNEISKTNQNCLLLGGSVAWGFGASSNENIPSYKIEKILNEKYKINLNVINLAEQSFSSIEECKSFLFSVYELNPSMIIILSGVNDINFEYSKEYKRFKLYDDYLNYYLWGDKLGIFRERNFIKLLTKIFLRFGKKDKKINDDFFYLKGVEEDQISYHLYKSKIDLIKNYSKSKNISVFNFLQPDLFFKQKKSSFEKKYEDFEGNEKKEFITKKLNHLKNKFFQLNNDTEKFKNLSLLDCFDNYEETIFMDRYHFTDKGYEILSEKISDFIYKNNKY